MRRISQILFTPRGAPIIHLSDQPGISSAPKRETGRAARSIPYSILLRRGFAARAASLPRRWSLAPPFHPCPCGRSVFCGTFHDAGLPCAFRPCRADPLPCGVRTFLILSDATGHSHGTAKIQRSRYSMRPQFVQATSSILCSTICSVDGGTTRWQPSHTESGLSGTATGQRFVRRRS